MKIGYDIQGDVLFVNFGPLKESCGAVELAPGVYLDQREDGTPLALEITSASKRYPVETLSTFVAYEESLIPLVDAARTLGVEQQALRKACERGRLKGQKLGRNWVVTAKDLAEYAQSRVHRGPGSAATKAEGGTQQQAAAG